MFLSNTAPWVFCLLVGVLHPLPLPTYIFKGSLSCHSSLMRFGAFLFVVIRELLLASFQVFIVLFPYLWSLSVGICYLVLLGQDNFYLSEFRKVVSDTRLLLQRELLSRSDWVQCGGRFPTVMF